MQSQTTTATEDLSEDMGHDDAPAEPASDDSEEEGGGNQQAAAGFTLDLGAAPGGDTKFRDDNFYGYDRGDNRYAEEGFAVGGRGEDMVLDLAGDENVSLAGMA